MKLGVLLDRRRKASHLWPIEFATVHSATILEKNLTDEAEAEAVASEGEASPDK